MLLISDMSAAVETVSYATLIKMPNESFGLQAAVVNLFVCVLPAKEQTLCDC